MPEETKSGNDSAPPSGGIRSWISGGQASTQTWIAKWIVGGFVLGCLVILLFPVFGISGLDDAHDMLQN